MWNYQSTISFSIFISFLSFLIPAFKPMAAKPFGAVTPPLIFFMVKFLSFCFSLLFIQLDFTLRASSGELLVFCCFYVQLDYVLRTSSRCVYVCYYLGNEVFFQKELCSFWNHSYCCGFVQIVMGILASKLADAYCFIQLDFALCAPSRCGCVCYFLSNEDFF